MLKPTSENHLGCDAVVQKIFGKQSTRNFMRTCSPRGAQRMESPLTFRTCYRTTVPIMENFTFGFIFNNSGQELIKNYG